MILDAITSSPLNVFFTFVIGFSLVYLYYRKPASSGTSTTRPTTDAELQRAIAQIERQERDMIRQEQDEAYQQSLRADREKQLKREEEIKMREAIEKIERERLARQEQFHSCLVKLKSKITNELPADASYTKEQDIVKLVFKLPDGSRAQRNFHKFDKVKHLYWYVFSLSNAPLQFKLTTNFPKRELPGRPPHPDDFDDTYSSGLDSPEPNCEQSLEEASLTETQIIFVYDLEA